MAASEHIHGNDDDAVREPESPEERSALKRNIAFTLALLVVLGAAIAIVQVDASVNESNTARETTRVAVRAMRANVVADTVADLEPVLQSEREFLPFRRPLTAGEPTLATAAGLPPQSAASAAGSLHAAELAVPDLGVGRLISPLQIEAQRLVLKQRALATTRITWNTRSTQYTTVIAVLAVALFLVGFGLVVEGPIRKSAYALGLAVAIFAAGWTAWIYHLPIPGTKDGAIAAVARAAVLTSNGSYRAALADYDQALTIDRDYAAAYTGRARARLLAANPDYPTTRAVTDVGEHTTAGAVSDVKHALELGDRDILNFDLLALTAFYTDRYDEAAGAVDQAVGINPKVPDVWLLKSAAEAALGEQASAAASLERALALLRGTVPSQRTRLLTSTYLSYLAWVERYVPSRSRAARRLADHVVAAETAFTLGRKLSLAQPDSGTVSVDGLRFIQRHKLVLQLRWRNLPAGTTLTVLGYEKPLARGAWTQPAALALFANVAGSGRRTIAVPLKRVCEPAQVRADVYLNGAPTLSRLGPGVRATC